MSCAAPETEEVRPRLHETDLLVSRRQRFAASMAALRQHRTLGPEGTILAWKH
jgi:hypothetical protein